MFQLIELKLNLLIVFCIFDRNFWFLVLFRNSNFKWPNITSVIVRCLLFFLSVLNGSKVQATITKKKGKTKTKKFEEG